MDFVDRVVGHDIWFTGRLLDRAAELPQGDLDRPVLYGWGWGSSGATSASTLRAILNEMVANKENWSASIAGRAAPQGQGERIEEMQSRYEVAGKEFLGLVRDIKNRGEWDAGFVDALCDPPQSFTYGGMLAHITTFSAFRRTIAVLALRELGVHDIGIGDPIEWERGQA